MVEVGGSIYLLGSSSEHVLTGCNYYEAHPAMKPPGRVPPRRVPECECSSLLKLETERSSFFFNLPAESHTRKEKEEGCCCCCGECTARDV